MTLTLGDISVRYVNLMLNTAGQLGVDLPAFKQSYALEDSLLEQAHARISIPKFMRLGHDIMQQTQNPELGIKMGRLASPPLMGLAGFTASVAPTRLQSLKDLIHYESLSSQNVRGHSTCYEEQAFIVSQFYSVSPYNQFNYFIVDLALSTQVSLLNQFAEEPLLPKRVDIEFTETSYAAVYEDLFQCPVHFNQARNALLFKKNDLTKSLPRSNVVTYAECRQICEQQILRANKQFTFQEQVMNAISPLLSSDQLTLERVALRMECPAWTLQRRLKAEGTTFKQMVDKTREELALIYIKDNHYSLGEIAYLLGFTYPNAFTRAFKRWTGTPPSEFRQSFLHK